MRGAQTGQAQGELQRVTPSKLASGFSLRAELGSPQSTTRRARASWGCSPRIGRRPRPQQATESCRSPTRGRWPVLSSHAVRRRSLEWRGTWRGEGLLPFVEAALAGPLLATMAEAQTTPDPPWGGAAFPWGGEGGELAVSRSTTATSHAHADTNLGGEQNESAVSLDPRREAPYSRTRRVLHRAHELTPPCDLEPSEAPPSIFGWPPLPN